MSERKKEMAGYFSFVYNKDGREKIGSEDPKRGGRCLLDFFAEDDLVKYGRGGVSQNIVVMMPVDEYVALCEPLKADDHKHHADLKKKIESGEIQRFDTIPLLRIRQMEDGTDAKVYGHDGRHRALLMKELGFNEIPVRLYAENFCWGENCGDGENGSAVIIQDPGAGLRGWPTWLWGQKDKGMYKEKQKFNFPVSREDSGKAFNRDAMMERATKGIASAMDGGKKKVYRDELGRLIGTAQMECGVLVFRDHMGRRVASGAFDGAQGEELPQ